MTEDYDDSDVRADLRRLAEDQPAVADWPGQVRRTLRRRRRQRQALLTGTAGTVALLLVVATAVAVGGSNETLETATTPTSPSASAVPSLTPPATVPLPSPAELSTPPAPSGSAPERSPEAPASPAQEPTQQQASPTASPSPVPPAAENAPRRRVEVRVDISSPARAEVGKEVIFDVRVRAEDGRPVLFEQSFGDMSSHGDPPPCDDRGPTPAPTPYDQVTQVPHTFERPGRYEVSFRALIWCQHVDGGGEGRTTIEVAEPANPSPGHRLSGGSFLSSDVSRGGEPRPLVSGTQLTVRFEERSDGTTVTWTSGCSRFAAPVVVGERQLDVKDITSADLDCNQQQEEQDEWLERFFAADPSWQLSGDGEQLVLTAEDTRIDLRRGS